MKAPWFYIVCEMDAESKPAPTVHDIQRAVCHRFAGIMVNDILSHRRSHDIAVPRQIAMYLSRILTRKSFPTIARAFGGMDHTTILYGCRKIERIAQLDPLLNNIIKSIAAELGCAA